MTTRDLILNAVGQQEDMSDKQKYYPSADNINGSNTPPSVQPMKIAGTTPEEEARIPKVLPPINTQVANKQATPAQQTAQATNKTYEEMLRQMAAPYVPPTQEQLEKERKKQKRNAIFAAIGDGISALSNLYFTTQGAPNAYDPQSGISAKMQERRDKLRKEREENSKWYLNAQMRARQMDQQQSNWREQFEYQQGRANAADKKDQRDFEYRQGRDKAADDKWQKTYDRQSEQWKKEFDQREKQYGRQNALAWAQHNLAKQTHDDANERAKERNEALAARGVRGKQTAFSDGKGNNVAIYENVWKGSMQSVYDAMVNEFENTRKNNSGADVPRAKRNPTTREMDDFVKQHWYKSAAARQMMDALSRIDPATMVSGVQSNSYDQYEVGGTDYSKYEVK